MKVRDVTNISRIYLSGTVNTGWRNTIKEKFNGWNIEFMDSCDIHNGCMGEVVGIAIDNASMCDVLFAFVDENDPSDTIASVMTEITVAFVSGKPVFLVYTGTCPPSYMVWMSHIFRTDLDSGIRALEMYLADSMSYLHIN